MKENVICPVTGKEAKYVSTLSKQFITGKLESYFNAPVPENNVDHDYDIYMTIDTGFQFAYPMTAGSNKFYNWITSQKLYYNEERWEWKEIIEQLKNINEKKIFLDIGCGSGLFLEKVHKLDNITSYGLDLSDEAIRICKEKDLNVVCLSLSELERNLKFDYISSFHTLEHVSNPLEFVSEMLDRLEPSGNIYLSTPYSPMSFEENWFDILNYPPHHLTRWNINAYKALAEKLDCHIEIYLPTAEPMLRRMIISLNLIWFGPGQSILKKRLIYNMVSKPQETIKELFRQIKRKKIDGKTIPDVILVKMWKKRHEN